MNMLLGGLKGRQVFLFMDDFNVGTREEEGHLEVLELVLDVLLDAGAKIKLS